MVDAVAFLADNSRNLFIGSIAYFVLLWGALVVWTANDLSRRPTSIKLKVFSLALVMVGNIFGFIVYLIIRPQVTYEETTQEELERKFVETQVQNFFCKACEFPVKEDYLLCPNCLKKLKNQCPHCAHLLETNWLACPFCGHNRLSLPEADLTNFPQLQKHLSDQGLKPAQEFGNQIQLGSLNLNQNRMVKRGRGRPRKVPLASPVELGTTTNGYSDNVLEKVILKADELSLKPPKRGRGRPRKQVEAVTSLEKQEV